MKILFIITTLDSGGAERVLVNLANYFSQFHEISVLRFDDKDPFYRLCDRVNLIDLPFERKGFRLFRILKKIRAQSKIMKDFDLIISFMNTTNILSVISNFSTKKPLIISEHGSFYKNEHTFINLLIKNFYKKASALTDLTKADFDEFDFVKNKFIMPNPMFDIAQETGFKKENLIIFVGRLTAIKDPKTFLNALSLVDKDLLKNYKIQMVGDGDLKNDLEKFALSLNLNIEFLGNVSNVNEIYKKAKIIVSSSLIEGLPNILMESIYFEVARISTETRGAAELIKDNFDGLLCEISNPNDMALKIECLIKDENLRSNLVKNANQKREIFKIENIYKKWMEIIDSVK